MKAITNYDRQKFFNVFNPNIAEAIVIIRENEQMERIAKIAEMIVSTYFAGRTTHHKKQVVRHERGHHPTANIKTTFSPIERNSI